MTMKGMPATEKTLAQVAILMVAISLMAAATDLCIAPAKAGARSAS